MWPEGGKGTTSITRRPLTVGNIFRNSMISLSNLLSSKVKKKRNLLMNDFISNLATVFYKMY
jgi:hypothetical protein